jgi:histidinol-phosphatase (PHP family)
MVDYHIHTVFSCDSNLDPIVVCERAIELGFDEIGFTEHLDFDPLDEGYGYYDYRGISEMITEMQSTFDDTLSIRKGVEVTYQKKRENEIREFLSGKHYDYVIGSVHLVGSFDVSQKDGTDAFFKNYSREDAFYTYFEVTRSLVESGIFDCLGHFEMIRRYALDCGMDYPYEEFSEIIDEILRIMIKNGIALEVNTSGIRHGPKETYPRKIVIRRYTKLGGKYVTIGSDSHLPEHIGFMIRENMDFLKSIGIHEITTFKNRKKRGTDV